MNHNVEVLNVRYRLAIWSGASTMDPFKAQNFNHASLNPAATPHSLTCQWLQFIQFYLATKI